MTGQARFTLDEAQAAEWLADEVAQFDRYNKGGTSNPGELEISSTWQPQDSAHDTQSVLYFARANGYLTGPGTIEYDDRTDEEEAGYCWLVYLDGPGSLKLSTYYQKIKWLGAGDVRGGADEALGVLRQAVFEANALLDDLDRYIAAREG